MTTIAVNRDMMAGDRQLTHASGMRLLGSTKLIDVPNPDMFHCKRAIIGFAGSGDEWGNVISWLHDPVGKPPKLRSIEMLMLNDKREIYHGTNMNNWLIIKYQHYAIGSGMMYAQAAMAAGKDPVEAVKIASKYDTQTGMGVTKLLLKPKP